MVSLILLENSKLKSLNSLPSLKFLNSLLTLTVNSSSSSIDLLKWILYEPTATVINHSF